MITPSSGKIEAFGLDPTGSHDSAPAIQRALDAIPGGSGGELALPPGKYKCLAPLTLKRSMSLRGFAFGDVGFGSTELHFEGVNYGVVVERGADWSAVSQIVIRGAGVQLMARAHLHGLFVASAPAHGLLIDTTVAGSNANNFRVSSTRITGCGADGVRITGADSNAGLLDAVDCVGNGGWGFHDTSLTSSTFLQCHAAANVLGGYRLSNSGCGGMLLNCYEEGDQPPSQVAHPAYVVGGTWGASDLSLSGVPASRTSRAGLRLGGGGSSGGALIETPVLLSLTPSAPATPLPASCSYLVPYIAAPVDCRGAPSIGQGTEGQRVTLRNNTGFEVTLHDEESVPGVGLRLVTPLLVLKQHDVLHLIYLGGKWYEEGRAVH